MKKIVNKKSGRDRRGCSNA